MNKVVCLIFLISMFSTPDMFSQKYKVEVVFNFGDTIQGYGGFFGDYIKFKKTKDSKPRQYHLSTTKSVKFLDRDRANKTYEYIKIKDGGFNRLQVVQRGRVSLYKIEEQAFGVYDGNSYRIDFYVKREHEKEATHLGSNQALSKSFKRTALKYFKDCPSVTEKIKNREFKKKNIVQMLYFYNINCKN